MAASAIDNDTEEETSGLSNGAIAGISTGVFTMIAAVVAGCIFVTRRGGAVAEDGETLESPVGTPKRNPVNTAVVNDNDQVALDAIPDSKAEYQKVPTASTPKVSTPKRLNGKAPQSKATVDV